MHRAEADAQPGQAGPLAEGTQHDEVGILVQERQQGLCR